MALTRVYLMANVPFLFTPWILYDPRIWYLRRDREVPIVDFSTISSETDHSRLIFSTCKIASLIATLIRYG